MSCQRKNISCCMKRRRSHRSKRFFHQRSG
jgi:hypothetical protein